MQRDFYLKSAMAWMVAGGIAIADERTPIGIGPHARTWSGLGSTQARGGEAVQYNPANLVLSSPFETQYELSVINLKYTYSYADTAPVEIAKTTVVPFVGASGKMSSSLGVGGYILPIPEDTEEVAINGVQTRKISATPVAVNAKQSGNGLGIKSGIGAGWKLWPSFALGGGLIYEKSGTKREIYAPGINVKVQSTQTKTDEVLLRLGVRWQLEMLLLSAASVVYGSTRTTGIEEQLGIAGNESKDIARVESYPANFNLGAAYRLGAVSLVGDVAYHQWKSSGDASEQDLFSTIDFLVGGRFLFDKSRGLIGSYAFFPGYKGDGLIASSNPAGKEISGMEVGEIDAMTRHSMTGGYEFLLFNNRSTTFINYQFGKRQVFTDGVAAGDHNLQILYLGFASQYKFLNATGSTGAGSKVK